MHFKTDAKIWFVVALSVFLAGCDYARRGGAYSLAFQPRQAESPIRAVGVNGQADLRERVERWLSSQGFIEAKGKQVAYWYKRGSHVSIYSEADGGIKIAFSAFGNRRDLRLSEETERNLMAYLEKLPDVKIARTEFPPPPKP